MRHRLTGLRDRLLSTLAIALGTALIAVVASTLEPSLSASAVPEPPEPAPQSDVSLLGLIYQIIYGSSEVSLPLPSGQSVLGLVFAFLGRYRLAIVATAVVLTVVTLVHQYRRRPAVSAVLQASRGAGDTTTVDDDRSAAGIDWPPETGPGPVRDAWVAMVRRVDDDVETPASRTPAEWRQIAVDAGLPADAVETITTTFRAVRYGGATGTDTRGRRVRAALDEIDARQEATDE